MTNPEVEYRVQIDTDIPRPSDDELDDLVDALRPVSGEPRGSGGTLSVTLSVDARDAPAAIHAGLEALLVALRRIHRTAKTMSMTAAPPTD